MGTEGQKIDFGQRVKIKYFPPFLSVAVQVLRTRIFSMVPCSLLLAMIDQTSTWKRPIGGIQPVTQLWKRLRMQGIVRDQLTCRVAAEQASDAKNQVCPKPSGSSRPSSRRKSIWLTVLHHVVLAVAVMSEQKFHARVHGDWFVQQRGFESTTAVISSQTSLGFLVIIVPQEQLHRFVPGFPESPSRRFQNTSTRTVRLRINFSKQQTLPRFMPSCNSSLLKSSFYQRDIGGCVWVSFLVGSYFSRCWACICTLQIDVVAGRPV